MANQKRFCTTQPIIPPYSRHPIIHTSDPRITLRPFHLRDLPALHELRSQIEVMQWTSKTAVDVDLATTRTWMERFMEVEVDGVDSADSGSGSGSGSGSVEPSATRSFNFVVVIQNESSSPPSSADSSLVMTDEGEARLGKAIGALGCHKLEPEAEVGYMIRKEYWGKGIVSMALKTFIDSWWSLERRLVDINAEEANEAKLQGARVVFDNDRNVTMVDEIMVADIAADNIASQRILEKCGFHVQNKRPIMENGVEITLVHYVLNRPSISKGVEEGQST